MLTLDTNLSITTSVLLPLPTNLPRIENPQLLPKKTRDLQITPMTETLNDASYHLHCEEQKDMKNK